MKTTKTRVAAERAVRKMADAADDVLIRAGAAAKHRKAARRSQSALRTAGKVALVIGAGAATAFAGKKVLARMNGTKRRAGKRT